MACSRTLTMERLWRRADASSESDQCLPLHQPPRGDVSAPPAGGELLITGIVHLQRQRG
jgi:hypothetical protein